MRLIMLGPPGAGKGTQASMLAEKLKIPHISTGDIFRAAISENTPLGIQAKAYMDRGELVPDDITTGIVREKLKSDECNHGFLLDGFPRTLSQAEKLDEILKTMKTPLNFVVEVRVGTEVLVNRLVWRRSCPICQKIYHLKNSPPAEEGKCDKCKVDLIHRSDDTREVIENRILVYEEKTNPLKSYYSKEGILVTVNGEKSIDEVMDEIVEKLGVCKIS